MTSPANATPAERIADEVAQLATRCGLADLPAGNLDAHNHAQLCCRWLWHVARGRVPAASGYPIAFVEATIAHHLDPARYWPLLCAVGQLHSGDVPEERIDAQRKIHDTIEKAANHG